MKIYKVSYPQNKKLTKYFNNLNDALAYQKQIKAQKGHLIRALDIIIVEDKKPNLKIFLGGTCNESTWRDELIPKLKINYFNPVVDNWTQECMKKEIEEREKADFCLYTITPKMTGVYSIAEVIDDSNKKPEKTILALFINDGGIIFSDSQWHSLQAVAKMVLTNGGKVFYTLEDIANYVNSFTV